MSEILNTMTPAIARAKLNDARAHLVKMEREAASFTGSDSLSKLGRKAFRGSASTAALMIEIAEEQLRLAEKWEGHSTYPVEEHAHLNALGARLRGESVKQALPEVIADLKAARLAAGLSQREVGELLGYEGGAAQQIIHRWESGDRDPGASLLDAWASALGMSLKVAPNS